MCVVLGGRSQGKEKWHRERVGLQWIEGVVWGRRSRGEEKF